MKSYWEDASKGVPSFIASVKGVRRNVVMVDKGVKVGGDNERESF